MQISEMMQIEPLNNGMAANKVELNDQNDLYGIINKDNEINPDDINFLSIMFGSAKDNNLKINLSDDEEEAEDKGSKNNGEIKTDDAKQENLNTCVMLNGLAVSGGEICRNGLIGSTEVTEVNMDTGESKINQKGLLKTLFDKQPAENADNNSAGITDNVNDKELNLNDNVIKSKDMIENTVMVSDDLDKLKKNIQKTGFDLQKPAKVPAHGDKAADNAINPETDTINDGPSMENRKEISGQNAVTPDLKNSIDQKPDKQAGLNRENIFYLSDQKSSEAEKFSENLQKSIQVINIHESKHIKNNIKGGEHNTDKNGLSPLNTKEIHSISDPVVNTKGINSGPKLSHTNIVDQIANKMVLSLKNGRSRVKMSLKPESLGHLRLEISSNDNKVDVKIMTQSAIVKDLIEHHISNLRTGLQGHGLEMEKVDVFVSGDSNQYSKKDEGYNGFAHGNPDHDKAAATDIRSDKPLSEPVLTVRMGTGKYSVDYFA